MQIPLPFEVVPAYGRDDFLVGKANETAFAHMARWPDWHGAIVLLVGPEGSGKTHLASIFAAESGARMLRGDALLFADVPGLAGETALVIEDADRFAPDEQALFHLMNLARETGLFLVLTARKQPDFWGLVTPDLISRLRVLPILPLMEPDGTLLAALLVKLFADRQLVVDAGLIHYILPRIERSYAAVNRFVAAIDAMSLTHKRAVSRAMVAQCLGEAETDDEDQPRLF
jgi:chromosomal replication initiation ATPase DnaA